MQNSIDLIKNLPKIEDLVTLITLAHTKNFTLAAALLGYSQPAISYRLKRLEKTLQIRIIERTKPTILFTKEGEHLLEYAEKIVSLLLSLKEYSTRKNNSLRVASSEVPGIYLLPTVIKEYKKKFPNIKIDIRVRRSIECIDSFLKGESDVIIVGSIEHPELIKRYSDFNILKIFDDEIVLAVPKKYPISNKSYIESLKEIIIYPLILRDENSGVQKHVEYMLKSEGIDLNNINVVMWADSAYTALEAAEKGLGITFVSKIQLKDYILKKSQLSIVNIRKSTKRSFYIISPINLSDKISSFIELCMKIAKECLG
jgi:DNA-binding transcriptional LysR family regulator